MRGPRASLSTAETTDRSLQGTREARRPKAISRAGTSDCATEGHGFTIHPSPAWRFIMRALAVGISLVALILCGCSKENSPSDPSAAATAPAESVADSIYFGGDIVTVNDAQPTAEAVAVRDGRIVAVGALGELKTDFGGGGHEDGRSRRKDIVAGLHRSA